MIRIHKEGIMIILVVFLLVTSVNLLISWLVHNSWLQSVIVIISVGFLLMVVWFFRNPTRAVLPDDSLILSAADGKVVVIEEVIEKEYFKDKRIQVSVFMSPLNVHANRYPISGIVDYFRYHPGKYLVAWHPKSSELNERSTVVIKSAQGREILVRQIAGAVARRIVSYAEEGKQVMQGDELGFIKFGSRVDLFLPADTKIRVKIGDKAVGNVTVIGDWQEGNR
jgi:phosphatidylserine decarboxylase